MCCFNNVLFKTNVFHMWNITQYVSCIFEQKPNQKLNLIFKTLFRVALVIIGPSI